MHYKWILPDAVDEQKRNELCRVKSFHPTISEILIRRHIHSLTDVNRFFSFDLAYLHDPYLLPDMGKAVDRLYKALRDGENILIYGDYDADGVTSVSILYDALFKLGGKVSFYIPNRFDDGYGVSVSGIKKARQRDISLIITVDCGITAIEEVAYARSLDMDVIICDHHEPAKTIPSATAVIDAKLPASSYPFRELAGCGVAFKLLQALYRGIGRNEWDVLNYLDLVAIGTSADLVPIIDENRILVKLGLDILNKNPRPGLSSLIETCGLRNKTISVSNIVFALAPRLNAVGRISKAKKAVHLLTTDSFQQGIFISKILDAENKTRKDIDEQTFREAVELLESDENFEKQLIIVLARENWHTGVVGIVSSRLMEKYHRPALLISIQDGVGKGSARSLMDYDIYQALNEQQHLLVTFGGHRFAAGLTILPENVKKLALALNQSAMKKLDIRDMVPSLEVDARIDLDQVDANFLHDIGSLAPYGPGNLRPVFVSYGLDVVGEIKIIGKNHVKMKLRQNGIVIDAIAYNFRDILEAFKLKIRVLDCVYVLEEIKWSGQTTLQMRIKDLEVIQ